MEALKYIRTSRTQTLVKPVVGGVLMLTHTHAASVAFFVRVRGPCLRRLLARSAVAEKRVSFQAERRVFNQKYQMDVRRTRTRRAAL